MARSLFLDSDFRYSLSKNTHVQHTEFVVTDHQLPKLKFPTLSHTVCGTFSHKFVETHSKKKIMRIAFPGVTAIWSAPAGIPHLWHTSYLASFCLLPLNLPPPRDTVRLSFSHAFWCWLIIMYTSAVLF